MHDSRHLAGPTACCRLPTAYLTLHKLDRLLFWNRSNDLLQEFQIMSVHLTQRLLYLSQVIELRLIPVVKLESFCCLLIGKDEPILREDFVAHPDQRTVAEKVACLCVKGLPLNVGERAS